MADDQHVNPYQSFGENDATHFEDVYNSETQPSAPRVLGVLNIIFGVIFGLCGLCYSFSTISQVAMEPQFQAMMDESIEQEREARQNSIDDLNEQLASAEDDAERARLQGEIDNSEREAQLMEKMGNPMSMMGFDKPAVYGSVIAICVITMLLNLFLFISGIGLLTYKDWGRRLGLWVAVLKLANLVLSLVLTAVVVTPAMAEGMSDFMAAAAEQEVDQAEEQDAPLDAKQIGSFMTMGYNIMAIFFAVLAAIYPVILIWQLRRPEVRQWCT